jgi:hypothetical protein
MEGWVYSLSLFLFDLFHSGQEQGYWVRLTSLNLVKHQMKFALPPAIWFR